MKVKLSNYISQCLVKKGIKDVFTVTGGGAMHLNDAFGHQKGLKCTYFHNEQGASTAAEGYYKSSLNMATVCVTTGPGGTNAITGVLCAYQDSTPILVISGQVKYENTVKSTNLNLREYGDQEFEICKMIQHITKYSKMITNPLDIKYELDKAIFIANEGRKGPVWLDIPLNIQAATIETDDLKEFNENEFKSDLKDITDKTIETIINKITASKRPIIYAGTGIRNSGGIEIFTKLINKLNIPVVCACNAIDVMESNDPLMAGIGGLNGDRPGNFAAQNSDLIISIGCRLSLRQVGFSFESWAREAYKIMIDADPNELIKPSIKIDMPICADAKTFMEKLYKASNANLFKNKDWNKQCILWRKKYPVVNPSMYKEEKINIYAFTRELSSSVKEGTIYVVGNASPCVTMSQCGVIKKDVKYIMNSGTAQMGYGLPSSIGACIACKNNDVVCVTGDGSIQMNIQELQTIVTNKLPLKLFVINNEGYHSIRQTQNNYFGKPLVGIGPESNDLGFPDFKKLAYAYGFKYYKISNPKTMKNNIKKVINKDGPFLCEVFVSTTQKFEPKCSSKKLEDGTMVSAPLEDLYPFLDREEFKSNMYINMVNEK